MKTIITKGYFAAALVALAATSLSGCKGDELPGEMQTAGIDNVKRIVLSPNSLALVADGKSELAFQVDFYYSLDGRTDSLSRMLPDRVPLDEVTITASDGKQLTPADVYTTTANAEEMTFTAEYGGMKSTPVTAKLYPAEQEKYEPLTIPVVFKVLYSPVTVGETVALTDSLFQAIIDRTNQVFKGTLMNAPSKADAGVTFTLQSVDRIGVTQEEEEDWYFLDTWFEENSDGNEEEVLTVWVTSMSNYDLSYATPWFTLGNADELPWIAPDEYASIDELRDDWSFGVSDMGINLTFRDILRTLSGEGMRFEYALGTFYGLVEPSFLPEDYKDGLDADLCADTYTYNARFSNFNKQTFPDGGGNVVRYKSFNLMESPSSCMVITRDQARQLRQVMKDVPFRQQGYKQ